MQPQGEADQEIGRVTATAHDIEQQHLAVRVAEGQVLGFGRASLCAVRFGHQAPIDLAVPRVAGWFLALHGRIAVQCRSAETGKDAPDDGLLPVARALLLVDDRGRKHIVEPGHVFAPAGSTFSVTVRGTRDWDVHVAVLRPEDPYPRSEWAFDEPTLRAGEVRLTRLQREILEAYAGPVLAGRAEPATHESVASVVYASRSTVRRELQKIVDAFWAARMWLPNSSDQRYLVVEAAIRHGVFSARER